MGNNWVTGSNTACPPLGHHRHQQCPGHRPLTGPFVRPGCRWANGPPINRQLLVRLLSSIINRPSVNRPLANWANTVIHYWVVWLN